MGADRILTWSFNRFPEGGILLPAYYMETDYEPTEVRIYADSVPTVNSAKFDILNNGVSIFCDKEEVVDSHDSYYQQHHIPNTVIELEPKESNEMMAEDFRNGIMLEEGTWVTCKVIDDSGARNVTVQLELQKMSESDEDNE
jgi:hypothetical protein